MQKNIIILLIFPVLTLLWVGTFFLAYPRPDLCADLTTEASIRFFIVKNFQNYYLPLLISVLLLGNALLLGFTVRKAVARWFKIIGIAELIFAVVIAIFIVVVQVTLSSARLSSIDGRRITDIKQVSLALELYSDFKGGKFPAVTGGSASQRWAELRPYLENGSFILKLPEDYCVSKGYQDHSYDYTNDLNGDSYVLKALLHDYNNRALRSEFSEKDGTILGVWCGEEGKEREYCIVPK